MRDIGLLLLGWLLGLLAPAIVDEIRRRREGTAARAAIRLELHELRYRIGSAAYYLDMRFGTIDRKYLEWVRDLAQSYEGKNPRESVLRSVEMQLSLTDAQIAAIGQSERAAPAGGVSVKKYSAPLLDTRLSSLWELDSNLQMALLEVRAQLDLMNEDVDQARYYFQLTFDDLSTNNRPIVEQNLVSGYLNIARRARSLADKIGAIQF